MLGNPKILNYWPRVRQKRDGSHVVRGWFAVGWRLRAIRRTARLATLATAFGALIVAALPIFGDIGSTLSIPRDSAYWRILIEIARTRHDVLHWLVAVQPELASALHINPDAQIVWQLAVLSIVLVALCRPIVAAASWCVAIMLPPVAKARFSVQVKPDRIRVRRCLWVQDFRNEPGAGVQIMIEEEKVGAWRGTPRPRQPSMRVVLRHGYRRVKIAGGMHPKDAERLSAALHYALDRRGGESGPFDPSVLDHAHF